MKIKLHKTLNDLSKTVRRKSIQLLNQRLADAIDLGLQAKQAHWNVKGPHFIALHGLFDTVADEVEQMTDEIAERAVALGGIAEGTVQCVRNCSKLPAYPLNTTSGNAHVELLAHAVSLVGASVRSSIDESTRAGDADTADLFTGVSRQLDKLLWLIEAHTQAKE